MKFIKNAVIITVCLALITLNVFAANATSAPIITLSNKTALPGEEVTIDISISNNPGIMAMAFCITYDSNSLEYTGYQKGYLSKYTLKDHPDKGHVIFVNDESSDKTNDGIMLSVKFKIKNDATPQKHIISIANLDRKKYGNNLYKSFSNSNLKSIEPIVRLGSITVAETCENSGHQYGDWNIIKSANCNETGLKTHTCVRCEYSEEATIPITHDFEAEWTVDKAATPDTDGEMSRHCKNCDATTDKIIFSYEEIGGDETPDDTTSSDTSSDSTGSENTSDISSDNSTSNEANSSTTETTAPSQDSNSSSTNNKKPSINNVVGEKVPQQEAEKLENYPQNDKPEENKPDQNNSNTSSENTPSQEVVSKDETPNSNNSVELPQDDDDSFFTTPTGIVMIIICSALSFGVLALGVILIIKNRKK
ncbi:MAG: hypothetical protein IKK65_01355 [Clostridia bacterium]|nr:hypothetical protein [Clostridia bacterium]